VIDASQHPEYVELMEQLEQSKQKRIKKVHNWKDYERKSIIKWYNAQKSQAWSEFYVNMRCSNTQRIINLSFIIRIPEKDYALIFLIKSRKKLQN
jgi:hypothetical protein